MFFLVKEVLSKEEDEEEERRPDLEQMRKG